MNNKTIKKKNHSRWEIRDILCRRGEMLGNILVQLVIAIKAGVKH
jgi:hypothetical protein